MRTTNRIMQTNYFFTNQPGRIEGHCFWVTLFFSKETSELHLLLTDQKHVSNIHEEKYNTPPPTM